MTGTGDTMVREIERIALSPAIGRHFYAAISLCSNQCGLGGGDPASA